MIYCISLGKVMSKKKVKVGNLVIGDKDIIIQSMTNTKTVDVQGTIKQILELENAGCELVRCTVPTKESAYALKEIVKSVHIPVVADIHFSSELAILAAENGASKIRINPGNIGDLNKVKYLANFLKEREIPIRIGVNGGSLDQKFKHLGQVDGMVQSVLEHVHLLEDVNFDDIVISCKSSNVFNMIEAYRKLSKIVDYPMHIGVTEAGTYNQGLIKNAIGIGALLKDNIGDTIRVSLTDDPVKEIYAAQDILKACNLYNRPYCEIISCPTCGRTEINVKEFAENIEAYCKNIKKNVKIAVMGCIVNGIGESEGADFGVAGGKERSIIFKDGKKIETIDNSQILPRLKELIDKY